MIAHSTGSRTSVSRSNPAGGNRGSKPASRSASEPDSASLFKLRAAKLPDLMKPDTGGEVMGASSRRALRGGWGRRMGIDQSKNLGDPAEWPTRVGQRSRGNA